jgi:hypothetical protein
VDIIRVCFGIPFGVVICYILLELAMHLCIDFVKKEVSQILLLNDMITQFLSLLDRVS